MQDRFLTKFPLLQLTENILIHFSSSENMIEIHIKYHVQLQLCFKNNNFFRLNVLQQFLQNVIYIIKVYSMNFLTPPISYHKNLYRQMTLKKFSLLRILH